MNDYAIRSIGIELGERELSVDELARAQGETVPRIESMLAGMVVHATSRSRTELAQAAVTRCLTKVGLTIAEVDLVITCRSRTPTDKEPPLEHSLGLRDIAAMRVTGPCPVLFQSIWMARAWLRSEGARRALVVYAETCEAEQRVLGPIHASAPRDIFSDAAGAVLIEQGAGLALRGYGNVQTSAWWEYFEGTLASAGDELQITRDSVEASKLAVHRCLETSRFSLDEIDAFILPNEVDLLMRFIARHLRIPAGRLVRLPRAPSHAWAVDPIHSLERLMRTHELPPAKRVVCLSRGAGIAAALALEAVGVPGVD